VRHIEGWSSGTFRLNKCGLWRKNSSFSSYSNYFMPAIHNIIGLHNWTYLRVYQSNFHIMLLYQDRKIFLIFCWNSWIEVNFRWWCFRISFNFNDNVTRVLLPHNFHKNHWLFSTGSSTTFNALRAISKKAAVNMKISTKHVKCWKCAVFCNKSKSVE